MKSGKYDDINEAYRKKLLRHGIETEFNEFKKEMPKRKAGRMRLMEKDDKDGSC